MKEASGKTLSGQETVDSNAKSITLKFDKSYLSRLRLQTISYKWYDLFSVLIRRLWGCTSASCQPVLQTLCLDLHIRKIGSKRNFVVLITEESARQEIQ